MKEIIDKLGQMETVDVFGFNCGVGAAHLRKLLEKQTFPKECMLSVLPNAGYQQELRGRMHYGDDPEYYAKQMERMIHWELILQVDVVVLHRNILLH